PGLGISGSLQAREHVADGELDVAGLQLRLSALRAAEEVLVLDLGGPDRRRRTVLAEGGGLADVEGAIRSDSGDGVEHRPIQSRAKSPALRAMTYGAIEAVRRLTWRRSLGGALLRLEIAELVLGLQETAGVVEEVAALRALVELVHHRLGERGEARAGG